MNTSSAQTTSSSLPNTGRTPLDKKSYSEIETPLDPLQPLNDTSSLTSCSNDIPSPKVTSNTLYPSKNYDFFSHTLDLLKATLGPSSSADILRVSYGKSELFQLHGRIAELETELLKKQSASDLEIHFLKKKLNFSENKRKASEEECTKLQKHRRLLFQSKEELQKKFTALEEDLNSTKAKHSAEMTELKNTLLISEKASKSLQKAYDHDQQVAEQKSGLIQTSINALESEVVQLQERCKKNAEDNHDLVLQMTEKQSRIDELEEKLNQQPILELRSETLELRAKEMDRQQHYVEQLEIDLSNSKRLCFQLQRHRSQLSVLEEEKLSLKQKLKSMEALRQQLLERESECESLRAQLYVWNTQMDFTPSHAHEKIHTLETQLHQLQETDKCLQQRLETLQQQKASVYEDLERLQMKNRNLDQRYWTLYTRTKTLESILVQKDQEIVDLKEQVQLWTQFTETSTLADSVVPDPLFLEMCQRDFRTEALKFKLAMELLFGFTLVHVSTDQIVVQSAFGNESETFTFSRTSSGLEFQGCPHESTLTKYRDLLDVWKERQCIPGFLSAVTLGNLKIHENDALTMEPTGTDKEYPKD